MVKIPPANAGNTGSIPGPGRPYLAAEQLSGVPQLLRMCTGTPEAWSSRVHVLQHRKPAQ